MPDRATVEAFVARVEAGEFVGAIEAYYAPEATMQENAEAPRIGRDTLVRHERGVLDAFPGVKATRLGPVLIGADHVAIRWRFEMTPAEGPSRSFEEVAWQTWAGDRIVAEQFFYDPRQMMS